MTIGNRVAPDGYDILVLLLDDGPTFVNTGTAGSAGNWMLNGDAIPGMMGLFGSALYAPGPTSSVRNGAGGANDITVPYPVSMSGWVFLRYYTSNTGEVFGKQYYLNAWSNPYFTMGIQMTNSPDGFWNAYVSTIGSGLQSASNNGTFIIPIGRWAHIGLTYDGTTLRTYLNGNPTATATITGGALDYGTAGNRGEWFVGGIPGTTNSQDSPFLYQDIRVANIARPASYFANIYYQSVQTFTGVV